MIETRLLAGWEGIVVSVALVAIVVLALCVMLGAVKVGDVPRYLSAIAGFAILLTMLPAIIVSLWNSMTFGQHLGIIALGIAIVFLLGASRGRSHNVHRK